MNKIMTIPALILALGASACSADFGDLEGEGAEVAETQAALTGIPVGFGFFRDSAPSAAGKCLDANGNYTLNNCYFQHDKKVNWKRGADGTSGPKFGIFLSEIFPQELAYQKTIATSARGWTIINDSAAEDIVEDVSIPGFAHARMIPSGTIDDKNNPAADGGGQRHMFHRCRVQIDLTKIEESFSETPQGDRPKVVNYTRNMLRREMFACLGLPRGGAVGNGPMIAGQPATFRDNLKEVTAAQITMLQNFAP